MAANPGKAVSWLDNLHVYVAKTCNRTSDTNMESLSGRVLKHLWVHMDVCSGAGGILWPASERSRLKPDAASFDTATSVGYGQDSTRPR